MSDSRLAFRSCLARPSALLALAFSAMPVCAEGPRELNELVVSAAGYEQELTDAPASISVISREKIERGAYKDITDVLRDVPGVIITGGGSGDKGADITMRGMPAAYTLLLR